MLKETTSLAQQKLANYTRTGDSSGLTEARLERIPQYRRLVYNVIKDILGQAFPITKKILGNEDFFKLCNDFFKEHNCISTQVWKMPKELIDYVNNENSTYTLAHSFLPELLLFEWLEIEVHTMTNIELPKFGKIDSIEQSYFVNPYHKLIVLQYPIHKKPFKKWNSSLGQYPILIYRNLKTHKVHFEELSIFGYLFLSELQSNSTRSFESALVNTLSGQNVALTDAHNSSSLAWLKDLNKKGIVFSV
jgi:hypothetical protein